MPPDCEVPVAGLAFITAAASVLAEVVWKGREMLCLTKSLSWGHGMGSLGLSVALVFNPFIWKVDSDNLSSCSLQRLWNRK